MRKFILNYVGDDGWSMESGENASDAAQAFIDLCDKLKERFGIEIELEDRIEMMEYALDAVDNPGKVIERRDFSTPESNYDLIYVR